MISENLSFSRIRTHTYHFILIFYSSLLCFFDLFSFTFCICPYVTLCILISYDTFSSYQKISIRTLEIFIIWYLKIIYLFAFVKSFLWVSFCCLWTVPPILRFKRFIFCTLCFSFSFVVFSIVLFSIFVNTFFYFFIFFLYSQKL